MRWKIILQLLFLIFTRCELRGFGPGRQNNGFVEVKPGAHMFWWLYYTTAPEERPLILWFSGGVGTSSSSFGNFGGIGPYDGINFRIRNETWVSDFNLLFVDNPLGAGYSYVDEIELLPRSLEENAQHIITLLKEFYKVEPQFKNKPMYLFSNSYGNRYVVAFVEEFIKAYGRKETEQTILGLVFTNPWICPLCYYSSYGAYLYNYGFVDKFQYNIIEKEYEKLSHFYDIHGSSNEFGEMALKFTHFVGDHLEIDPANIRSKLVKLSIRPPAFDSLEELLNNTDINTFIINGSDDLMTSTIGQLKWMKFMNWRGVEDYRKAKRKPLWSHNILQGYYKQSPKFTYIWMNQGGHFPFRQNPEGCREAVRMMTGF